MATTITITGAGGQIGYALLFRIAAGDLLGPDEPVRHHIYVVGVVHDQIGVPWVTLIPWPSDSERCLASVTITVTS